MTTARDRRQLVATSIVLALFCWIAYGALGFNDHGRWFPLMAGVSGTVIVAIILVRGLVGRPVLLQSVFEVPGLRTANDGDTATTTDQAAESPHSRAEVSSSVASAALAIFPIPLLVLGIYLAIIVWLPVYLRLVARADWRSVAFAVAGALAVVFGLEHYFMLDVPKGLFFGP